MSNPKEQGPLLRLRPVCYPTPLSKTKQVLILTTEEESGRAAGQKLKKALHRFNPSVEVLDNPAPSVLRHADGPIFLLGNLANSRCVREFYFRFLCVTDRWYPGPKGYELRVLLNPFANGYNVIHLGYSDDAGLDAGLAALLERLEDPLPLLREIKATRLPVPANEVKRFLTLPLPEDHKLIANDLLGDQKGYLGYLTGDQNLMNEYGRALEATIAYGSVNHLFALSRVLVWRLFEHCGLLPESLRQPMLRFIYDWAEGNEGLLHIKKSPGYLSPHVPRQNHGLLPALALVYAADYFLTHYPELSAPQEWRRMADLVFSPYGSSWKSLEDGLCHGWILSQPVMLEYGLMDPAHRYFEAGGARKAADCAMAIVNNQGWMPSAGDSDILRAFPGPSLRAAAAYYNEGKYLFIHQLAPESRRHFYMDAPTRAFDVGLEPAEPTEQIPLTVIPMDPLIYHVWEKEPELAPGVAETPPSAPMKNCFDKIILRSGWNENDDYLLIDGLGGADHLVDKHIDCTHSYADAGGILDYARFGVSGIVSEDCLIFTTPEDHSLVTITRNGERGAIPAFAALEAKESDNEGNIYLRIRLAGYAGTDWEREIFFRRGRCVVFHDTIMARDAGDYAIEAHFRTPARAWLEDHCLISPRHSRTVGKVTFRLLSLNKSAHLHITTPPFHILYKNFPDKLPFSPEDDAVAQWRERYQTTDVALTHLTVRQAVTLQPGESVSFTHLAQIQGPGEPVLKLHQKEKLLILSDAQNSWPLPCFQTGTETRRPSSFSVASQPLPVLTPEKVIKSRAPITCMKSLSDDRLICGMEDGSLALIDAEGHTLWQKDLEKPFYDISVVTDGKHRVIGIGHGAACLTMFDESGETLWSKTIVRDPSHWPWFELATPAPVQVAGGIFAGETLFAVGCGDSMIRLFDKAGHERWRDRFYCGVPGRIRVADFDGDGMPEIAAAGEISCMSAVCRILTHTQQLKTALPVEGWTSLLTAMAWKEIVGRHLMALGANRGRNLHLYDLTGLKMGEKPRHILEKKLGGKVTGLAFDGGARRLLASTSQGFLLAYGMEGEQQWVQPFESAIREVFFWNDLCLVQEEKGATHLLSSAGKAVAVVRGDKPRHSFCLQASHMTFASGKEVYRLNGPGDTPARV